MLKVNILYIHCTCLLCFTAKRNYYLTCFQRSFHEYLHWWRWSNAKQYILSSLPTVTVINKRNLNFIIIIIKKEMFKFTYKPLFQKTKTSPFWDYCSVGNASGIWTIIFTQISLNVLLHANQKSYWKPKQNGAR